MTKSLALYFFYDKDGVVDDYVYYYLEKLLSEFNEICFVSNVKISQNAYSKLSAICSKIIIRANIGLDAFAYKEALESYGYDEIKKYDRLLLNNFTCYGPIYPFSELFNKMSLIKCDFWGHCVCKPREFTIHEETNTTLYEHLMSYFVVFNSSVLKSDYFSQYWNQLPNISGYSDSVGYHESKMTRYFSIRGFKYFSFINIDNYIEQNAINHVVTNAAYLLLADKNPLLKRKVFEVHGSKCEFSKWKWPQVNGYTPFDILNFIKKNTNYPTQLIAQNLMRTYFSKSFFLKRKLKKYL